MSDHDSYGTPAEGANAAPRDHDRGHHGGDAGDGNEARRIDANRTYWRSRRGMLELDLLLPPFAYSCYPKLTARQQAAFRRLLECDDQQIWAWLQGIERPRDPATAELVALIGRGRERPGHPA